MNEHFLGIIIQISATLKSACPTPLRLSSHTSHLGKLTAGFQCLQSVISRTLLSFTAPPITVGVKSHGVSVMSAI